MYLSVVIPFFNEEKNIKSVLDEHLMRLKDLKEWEILCLDDASTDKTWDVLKKMAGGDGHIRLLQNQKNLGISPSYQRLFNEARGDYIYLTGGDGQWPAENLTRLLGTWQKTQADLVIGVRQDREKVYSFQRRILSYGFNYLARIFLRFDAQDVNGIKLGRRDFFTTPVRSGSFFAEVERIAAAHEKGYKIVYVPVIFLTRLHGKPNGAQWKNVLLTFRDFVRFLK